MCINLRHIGLIGLGPHARRIYYPLIENYAQINGFNLVFVIELQEKQYTITTFLKKCKLQPLSTFFIKLFSDDDTLPCDLQQFLNNSIEQHKLDGIIIASEPKSHKAYLKWALQKNINILIDKPITCPKNAANDRKAALKIIQDFNELKELYQASRSNLIVQTQRRAHFGYCYIYNYLSEFMSEFQVPITHIDVSHADGMWVMPNEWEREHHSYKYGTGKLMHSGYHFIDLLAWFLQLNQSVKGRKTDELDLFVRHSSPSDFMHHLSAEHYQQFFHKDYSEYWCDNNIKQLKEYGEQDVFVLAQLKRQQSIVTTATLNLQQNSFSTRAWPDAPVDVYKGNGRIRHEQVNIHVSVLLNIQVHSYQSYQANNPIDMEYGSGHIDHFDILIFRNNGVLGGKAFEQIEIGRDWPSSSSSYLGFSHNEIARENLFLEFIRCSKSKSDLVHHSFTNELLGKIYECIALERNGKLPHISCPLN